MLLRDGSPIYLEPVSTTLRGDGGEPLVQVVLRDVTDQRRRQEDLRTYAGHMLRAQEDERRRVAQELHDDVLQSLIMLVRQLDRVEGAGPPSRAPAPLQAARALAGDLVARVRDFARQMRPPALEELGLVTALQRALDDVTTERHAGARTVRPSPSVHRPPHSVHP